VRKYEAYFLYGECFRTSGNEARGLFGHALEFAAHAPHIVMRMENNKTLIIGAIVFVVLVAGVGYLLVTREPVAEVVIEDENVEDVADVGGDDVNSIIVQDQIPGSAVIFRSITLAQNGFVVVRDQINGQPGRVMGSLFVEAGAHQSGSVQLTSPTVEGGIYYVELYADTNANGTFDEGTDEAVMTALGQIIRVEIETIGDLPEVKG